MKNLTRTMALVGGAVLSSLAVPMYNSMSRLEAIQKESTVQRYGEVSDELRTMNGYNLANERSLDHFIALSGELKTFQRKPYIMSQIDEVNRLGKESGLYFIGALAGALSLGAGIGLTLRNRRK